MSKLIEHKGNNYHYYEDDQGRRQGEYKWWDENGQLRKHCFYKDGKRHGEFKYWFAAKLSSHCFYKDNINITDQVKALVEDIKNITKEERMLIKLKFGIECLC